MALFSKKKNQPQPEEKNPAKEIKTQVLECLNEKLNGNLYDECVIMPRGFTIDIQMGRQEEKDGIKLLQVVFIVRNDEFDEALIEPVDAQGKTEEDAVKMAVEMFYGAVWHPLDQAMNKRNGLHLSINYLRQHYDFDMYAQSVVRTSTSNGQPVMLINYIKSEIPKYIGSKKYYWVRIYLSKYKDRKVVEVRVNGSVCAELSRFYQAYVDSWNCEEAFMMEKQYAIFVQREDDQAPEAYKKEHVVECAKQCIEMMENCNSRDEYMELVTKLEEITGDKNLASEIRIFIPEIFAKLTLGYREGDSLFLIEDEGTIEFKKTQLRSYFYLQQVVLEYFTQKPEREKIMKIVSNSVAFRELKKAHEQGHEPKDLFVPGTSYKTGTDDYKVW
ncbi:MAG: hypothetical protein K2K89_04005 [Ruminococcus sp.]|nr:DUF6348 family protein [Alistipes senegalensis]MDE6425287.1 hypothetical protein [Ruminococcus sp.]